MIENEGISNINPSLRLWNNPKELGKETNGTGDLRKNRNSSDHNTAGAAPFPWVQCLKCIGGKIYSEHILFNLHYHKKCPYLIESKYNGILWTPAHSNTPELPSALLKYLAFQTQGTSPYTHIA